MKASALLLAGSLGAALGVPTTSTIITTTITSTTTTSTTSSSTVSTTSSSATITPTFIPPGPDDVRGPCPLLNSLANEGILPRNGMNYTIPLLIEAFTHVNMGADVAQSVGMKGIALSPIPNSDSFNLNDLDKHNAIEHDGSLSRDDFFFGDDHDFNMTIFSQAAAFYHKRHINIMDAAMARHTRQMISQQTNPNYTLSMHHASGSLTEASFYLSIFGDPVTGIVPEARWVRFWFEQQRLPFELGWTPRAAQTNLTTLAALSQKVLAATPNSTLPENFVFEFQSH